MKKIICLIAIVLTSISCSNNDKKVAELLKDNNTFEEDLKNENLLLINSLRNYENDAHIVFQEDLYQSANDFIRKQSENFVDNETGFFKLWSEVFSFFESDTKKNARWKSRLEKYFRATEYLKHIENKQTEYSNTINLQRQELLGKLHTKNNVLIVNTKSIDGVTISNNKIVKVVDKVNKLVLIEVIPKIIESLAFPVFISVIGLFFGIILGPKTKGIIFVVSLCFSIWQSVKYSNELEQQINDSFALTEKQHLTVLPALNQNTKAYFNELTTKIQP